jgi:histidinol-phosphate aminotransferase
MPAGGLTMILQPDLGTGPAGDGQPLLDLSENLSPIPSGALRTGAQAADRATAPGRLRDALATAACVRPDQVLPANGSLELIHRLCRSEVRPGDRVVLFAPTFGELGRAASTAGASVETIDAVSAEGYVWNRDAACARLRAARPAWVFLCNPNNPTGVHLDAPTVNAIVEAAAPGRLVLDEAYRDFVDSPWDAIPLLDRGVVILRSITKLHGMVSMQFGHLLADAPLVARLAALEPRWEVNDFAAAAALAAEADPGHAPRVRAAVTAARGALLAGLTGLGLTPFPSATNFFLVPMADSRRARWNLLRERVLVKDGGEIGLPGFLRVSVPPVDAVPRVVAAFGRALAAR